MKRFFQHNWRLKVIAFLLALLIWFFVNSITNERRLVQAVPVEVRTRPGVTVMQQEPTMVDVMIRGTRNDMRQVSRDDLSVVLDLSRVDKTGEFVERLGPATVRHPRWVQPIEVIPARATVVIDQIAARSVRVEPQFVHEPAPGYRLQRVEVNPESVRVIGPEQRLQELHTIVTLPVELSGRTMSFRERTELNADGLADVSLQRGWVEVDVRIEKASAVETAPGTTEGDNHE